MKHLSAALLVLLITGSSASAQRQHPTAPNLESVLRPGMTAWITDSSGREERVRIISMAGDVVTASADNDTRRLRMADVMRVRVRHSDCVLNGALIGAGAAIASGLFLCTRTEPWENCSDDAGSMVGIGALGAGIGIGIDAAIRGRRTIYESRPPRLAIAPIVTRRASVLFLRVSF